MSSWLLFSELRKGYAETIVCRNAIMNSIVFHAVSLSSNSVAVEAGNHVFPLSSEGWICSPKHGAL